jgi:two-component system, chemotaxis family, CheB/CheR fusion protein
MPGSVETWEIPTAEAGSPEIRSLEVTTYRQSPGRSGDPVEELAVVLVRDVSTERSELAHLRGQLAADRSTNERLTAQLERATEVVHTLHAANSELTVVNAELRSQNDDLVVANEEVQAATEEVETLNEEMQATNEELETLNEEMQATVEELNTTNDDLEARSLELQNLALSLEKQREVSEAERARLQAVLASMAEAVLVVEADGDIVLTNEAYDAMVGRKGLRQLVGEDGNALDASETPQARAARGETFTVRFTRAGDGPQLMEADGRPLPAGGGVVVLRTIDG